MYVGLWQVVKKAEMSWINTRHMWHVKFPFTTDNTTCVCLLEEFMREPTLIELGTLKLHVENLMRDVAMRRSEEDE